MADPRAPLVLVIDPDPRTASSLVPILESEGYRAASCPSSGVRVILLTEAEDWPSRLDASDAGADDLQRRSCGRSDLLESVRGLLEPGCGPTAIRSLKSRVS
jgi:DNA-binding NarL/FixJ family response regulator